MHGRGVDPLLRAVLEHHAVVELDHAQRRRAVRELAVAAGADEPDAEVARIEAMLFGWGPLAPLFDDPDVSDILVNGPNEVWVERGGTLELTGLAFPDAPSVEALARRELSRAGARIDQSHPIADAVLDDGSRIHAVLPPIAPDGPLVSVRRLRPDVMTLDHLVAAGALSRQQAERLVDHVRNGASMVIAGRTGAGKTTLLDALCGHIPDTERVVVIEETRELSMGCFHSVSLTSRGSNLEGTGEVPLDELVRAALRMRPDRIVIGEARGSEAYPALSAMSSGHAGSMLTVHASTAATVPDRLAALALEGRTGWDHGALRDRFVAAIDVVVHLVRDGNGRRVAQILEL